MLISFENFAPFTDLGKSVYLEKWKRLLSNFFIRTYGTNAKLWIWNCRSIMAIQYASRLLGNEINYEECIRMEWNSTLYDKKHDFVAEYGKGLLNWMKQFYASELAVMSEHIQVMIFEKVEELMRDILWNEEEWVVDYQRLRTIAHI